MIHLRRAVEHLAYRQRKNFFHKAALVLPSLLFHFAAKMRNNFYEWGFLPQKEAPLPVVSIGNIAVGGSGKTPLVLMLAEELSRSFRVGIVSRGYRRRGKQKEPLLLSNGSGPLYSAAEAGDESSLLAERLPGVVIVVGKDRLAGAKCAAEAGAEVVILDDGMQHRRMKRHFEIVSIQGREAEAKFFPLGYLRDEQRRLKEADLVILQGEEGAKMQEKVAYWTKAPCVRVSPLLKKAITYSGKEIALHGLTVALFCGIADPQRFVRSVEQAGAKVVKTFFLADHEKIGEEEIRLFSEKALDWKAQLVLCTEKDWVKIKETKIKTVLPLAYVSLELTIAENEEAWKCMIGRIKESVK